MHQGQGSERIHCMPGVNMRGAHTHDSDPDPGGHKIHALLYQGYVHQVVLRYMYNTRISTSGTGIRITCTCMYQDQGS